MLRPILVVVGFFAIAFACQEGWESYGTDCYKYDNTDRNYADSEAFCVEEGGHITSIESDEENVHVIDRARELELGNTWIGLDDNAEENIFENLDMKPFYRGGYTNAEPNDWGGLQDCAYFPFRVPLGWDDMRCTNNANFVCERPAPCSEGWIGRELTDDNEPTCYKWFSDRVSFDQAKQTCYSLGAYLVSITDKEENVFVIEDVAGATSGQSGTSIPNTWIGMDDENDEGEWNLVQPGSVEFMGRFSRGEPNNGGGNQNCIWFPFREPYHWDDVSCGASRKVVCKKPNPEMTVPDDLTEQTVAIIHAMFNTCRVDGVVDGMNICEKLEEVFDELIDPTSGGGE